MDQAASDGSTNPVDLFVHSHPLFEELDPTTLLDLESELEQVILLQGKTLFQQGEQGDSFYLLLRGVLEVSARQPSGEEARLDVLEPGGSVGEMSLITGQPRTATVRGLVDSELLRLSKAGFARLVQNHPQLMDQLALAILPRFQRTQLAGIFQHLFGSLDAAALHALHEKVSWIHLNAGETLFQQGESSDALYIVMNGRLKIVSTDIDGKERPVSEVSRGETVGEFALLSSEPRSASVIAVRDSELVSLSRPVFESLLDRYPKAMLEITRTIVRRSWSAAPRPAFDGTATTAIAVLPADPALPTAVFTGKLVEALAEDGPVLYLTSSSFDSLYGKTGASQTPLDHPANLPILAWLSNQEASYRYIVYQADPQDPAWSQRCLHQSDRILLLADGTTAPDKGQVEQVSGQDGSDTRLELVLLQPDRIAHPSGTRSWLAAYPFHAWHHLRLGLPADMHRLSRRLTGRAVGLVLSGGGARGFAHIGAIRALEEAGVQIDLLGGTSMGALLSGAQALGLRYEQIQAIASTFASPKKLLDYTLPFTALVASKKVSDLLQQIFGDIQIEDLWQPFYCVSSNLTRAEPLIHRSGSLWEAVRASIAIPGIFSPLQIDNDVLVDGGVMNIFPVDVMFELAEGGPVIAINASNKKDKFDQYHFGSSVNGWKTLLGKLNPFGRKQKAPSILSSLMRSTEINSIYRRSTQERLASLLITPPVENFGSLDFAASEQIIQIGYETARLRIAEWKALPNSLDA